MAVIPSAICPSIIPSLGFEPRQRDPKSLVLPLHYEGRNLTAVIVHYDS